ncbi:MAG: ABC transporter permease [Acidobacteria bacterium]|nr:ABC transporter permease [Acidobacteriota bacterium]
MEQPDEQRLRAPEKPIVSIRPSGKWSAIDLTALWAHRELLYFLTWRDVKVRYKQTVLGAAWAIIQPLFTMLIFTLFFNKIAGIKSGDIPYPLFAYAGLLPWTFFSNSVTNSSNSLVGSANLITKVYFPRMIIPGSAVAAGLVDFAIAFAVLVILMFYYRVTPTMNLIMLPFMVMLTALLALGVGMWMSALNVKYRDIRYALPFAIQLLMFATPIIYPSSMVPAPWKHILIVNPLAGIIEGYRSALFAMPFHWTSWGSPSSSRWHCLSILLLFQEHRTHLRRYCLKKERESTTPLYPI